MSFKYFVFYVWTEEHLEFKFTTRPDLKVITKGYGNVEFNRTKPVLGIEDVQEWANLIKQNPANNIPPNAKVVVQNWRRFEDDTDKLS